MILMKLIVLRCRLTILFVHMTFEAKYEQLRFHVLERTVFKYGHCDTQSYDTVIFRDLGQGQVYMKYKLLI